MKLIPNRDCGECTACCHHIPIDQDDFVKLPNIDCEHLVHGLGCGIYKKRPNTCASWYCSWRYLSNTDENWRPDKCGILMDFTQNGIPEEFPKKTALVIKIIDKEKAINHDELYAFITFQLKKGLPLILSHGREYGYSAASGFLNYALQQDVDSDDIARVKQSIVKLIEDCEKLPKAKLTIKNGRISTTPPQ